MPEAAFRSLRSMLLPAAANAPAQAFDAAHPSAPPADFTPVTGESVSDSSIADPRIADLLDGFAAELKRLTVRAAEVFEERAEALLADLAARVLGRELQIAPADIATLLAHLVDEFGLTDALVVRVSRADAGRLATTWPVQIDPALHAGDFAVDIDNGSYDVAFATRLDALLARHRVTV